MNTPPPVPIYTAPKNQNPFARVAATVCMVAPFIVVALSIGFTHLAKNVPGFTGRNLQVAALAYTGVSCLLIFVGLIMGILALLMMTPDSRRQVVCQSSAGILATVLILVIAVPNFVRARTIALANTKAYLNVTQAAKELDDKAVASLKTHQADPGNLDDFQQKIGQAAVSATGNEALVLKAGQDFAARIGVLQKSYQQSMREMKAATVLCTSNLVNQSDIQERRGVVQKFMKSNDDLKVFTSQNEEIFRQELTQRNVPIVELEKVMSGFSKSTGPQSKLVVEIRDSDRRAGEAMLGVLDLLDANWGHWKYMPETGHVRIEDTAALAQYNAFMNQISQARADQIASQNQLALLFQRHSSDRAAR